MQYPSAIYCDSSCIGSADACYGITNECATGIACWYICQNGHTTSATMAVANVSLETIDVCDVDMVSQIDNEAKSICSCYSACRSNCHLGVSLDITIDCCTVTSFWQKIVDKGCISMTYV